MQVVFHCYDAGEQSPSLRLEYLQEHLAWVKSTLSSISVAGPLVEENGQNYCGSMYVIEADSLAQAQDILHQDPYYKAGIWNRIESHEFKAYAGNWVGGENWPQMP